MAKKTAKKKAPAKKAATKKAASTTKKAKTTKKAAKDKDAPEKKKKKAAPKKRAARAVKEIRLKAYWGVFNQSYSSSTSASWPTKRPPISEKTANHPTSCSR